jgi:hypothetical protein
MLPLLPNSDVTSSAVQPVASRYTDYAIHAPNKEVTHFNLGGERRSIVSSEGSQAPHVRPSNEGSVQLKILRWLQVTAWERGSGIFVFLISGELCNLEK